MVPAGVVRVNYFSITALNVTLAGETVIVPTELVIAIVRSETGAAARVR